MRMGVIPVCAGTAFGQSESVDAFFARRHAVLWVAVLIGGYRQTMPVHGRGLRQLIFEEDFDLITLEHLNLWPWQLVVIKPKLCWRTVSDGFLCGGSDQCSLELACLGTGVFQARQCLERTLGRHAIEGQQGL